MTSEKNLPQRERRPSVGVPIVDIQGSVGPAGISRPKHKRTLTGFGASEIKTVEGAYFGCISGILSLLSKVGAACFGVVGEQVGEAPPELPLTTNAGFTKEAATIPAHNTQQTRKQNKTGHTALTTITPLSQPPSPNPSARPG